MNNLTEIEKSNTTNMAFKTNLTHQEVMRISFRSGQLIRHLHGKPGLVIGIARGGVPPAQAFAAGAGIEQTETLLFQRPSSSGLKGELRKLWVRMAPDRLRLTYKQLMFKRVVKITDMFTPDRVLPLYLKEQLNDQLKAKFPGPVVVIDDAIDSGGTIKAVVNAITELNPNAEIIVFSLATTLGRRVAETQYTLVSGHIAHFVDGDLAYVYEDKKSIDPVGVGSPNHFAPVKQPLEMYLDLDGTLTTDSFRDAINCLARLYLNKFAVVDSLSLATIRLLKKARLINHSRLKKDLDQRIRQLNDQNQAEYFDQLARRLRSHGREALHAAAKAPSVNAAIVTAALSAYKPAIEKAFDLPVISGSGIDHEGRWVEIGSDEKIIAIENHRSKDAISPAVLFGDTLTDGMALGSDLNVITIPSWDKTGLSTMLGIASWWFNNIQIIFKTREEKLSEY